MKKSNTFMPNNELKIFFEPRKEFIEETRILFLSRVETINKKEVYVGTIFTFKPFLKYALATVFIVMFLGSGLVIYADTKNVDVNNPLYGFKKTGEKVRLVIAPKERKPIVNHQIAERRVEEMEKLKDKNNNMMKSLDKECNKNLNLSLNEIDDSKNEKFKELCKNISETMAKKVEIIKTSSDDHTPDNFKEHCGQFMMLPPVPVK
jgi:hypothetical protein